MRGFVRTILGQTRPSYAPRSAGMNLSMFGRGGSDRTAQLEAMGAVSTLYSVVNRLSNAVAQVDWHLYRASLDGRRAYGPATPDRRQVLRHAALDLWNRPNDFYTRADLVETGQQHYELTGETWTVVVRDPRSPLPLELWPVRPDRMEPVPSERTFISGYVYTAPSGEKVPLGLDDVIFTRTPNPTDPYRGLSPVAAAMVDLDSARYSAEWNRNFFRNSAEPGGILQFDKRLTDEEFEEVSLRWAEQHRGVAAAHRVAILEQGQWVDRKYTQRDMQFHELRGLSREIIREAFGIHSHMLGLSEDVNKANAEMAEISFARWLVYPRVQRIRDALNNRLLPLYGAEGLEFDHAETVPPDREADDRERTSKAQAAQLLVVAGYDPADVAAAVGLPPMGFAAPTPAGAPATAAALNGHAPAGVPVG